ncbi:MAG: 3'-5' exonuclease [Oscillospiraceae bacterium]|jgi:DNA polymerase-3 subunit epsilon|nr:3'-5' exonuclease [Oscillospiraceae bacterium]
MFASLFKKFDNIIVLDVETTGIDPKRDEIIELAALCIDAKSVETGESVADEFDLLVRLSEGRRLPEVITRLTGITEKQLSDDGVSKEDAARRFAGMLSRPNPLVVAYNAQFDLCFLYYFLKRLGHAALLKNIKMFDALTVYKDRRPYPHKLGDAVAAYSLKTQNTHRAIDDARATLELMCAMETELDDLDRYINLFGYNPKHGVSGPKISSINYLRQEYSSRKKLYE